MPTMQEIIKDQRKELANNEALVFAKIQRRFILLDQWAATRLSEIVAAIQDREALGVSRGVAMELERIRLTMFLAEIRREISSAISDVAVDASQHRELLGALGLSHSEALLSNGIDAAGINIAFTRAPIEAVQQLILAFDQRAPLRGLLENLVADGADRVREILEREILRGEDLRRVSRQVREAIGVTPQRAQLITRTEAMRAYRGAADQNYQLNRDLLEGWRWVASLSPRTCPSCLALHGTIHPLDEEFGEHPAGRCTPAPVVIGDTRQWETGSEWVARQSAATRQKILGIKGAALYDAGTPLSDWVHESNDGVWGLTRRARTPR